MTRLDAEGVRYRYRSGDEVLRGLSLSLRSADRLALVGPNGAGKSTLLRCLLGLLQPSAGTIRLDGASLTYSSRGLTRLRARVGLLLQDPDDQLLASVVEDDVGLTPRNLGVSAGEVSERVEQALEQVGLQALRRAAIHSLSVGQKKRVALAGLLTTRPALLILDEPSAGLDVEGCRLLLDVLGKAHETGLGVLIATHDLDLAFAWADEFAFLQDGVIARRGPAEEVFSPSTGPRLLQVGRRLTEAGWLSDRPLPRSWAELLSSLPQAREAESVPDA